MLIRFNVNNFLSFNETQEFSMIAGKVRTHPTHIYKDKKLNLLKFTAIYGANAAGKSNIVRALEISRKIIVSEIPLDTIKSYCRLTEENKNKPSLFEFEIKLGKKSYAYGFDIILSQSSIIEEWLYELDPNGNDREIFTRKPKEGYVKFSPMFKGDALISLETYSKDMLTNNSTLFLTEMNRNKNDLYIREKTLLPLKEVYLWFERGLIINYPGDLFSPAYFMEGKNLKQVNSIISDLGLGVNEIEIADGKLEELQKCMPPKVISEIIADLKKSANLLKKKGNETDYSALIRGSREFFILEVDQDTLDIRVKKLLFKHTKNEVRFEVSEESDGTRRLLDLIELIVAAKTGEEKVYVIDEINRYLHPQVTYRLLSQYLDSVEDKKIQLIVTTHESHLMDLNLLRRDEIWFINKNDLGESNLYSLDQYNTRFDKKIRRAYLDGRYGGVPLFDNYFPMTQGDE